MYKKLFLTTFIYTLSLLSFNFIEDIEHSFIKLENEKLLFNNEELIPPFSTNTLNYHLPSLSALNDNIISVGNQKKKFKLSKINPEEILKIKINNKIYKLHLYPKEMPQYYFFKLTTIQNPKHILLTQFEGTCKYPSYGFIINELGDLLYYRNSSIYQKCVSDFKKINLPNGKKYYSLMQQTEKMPPWSYWTGNLEIFDTSFNKKKTLRLLETDKHPALGIENHESIILDDNHYILTSYHTKEIFHPENNTPLFIAEPVIQEVKDGKILLDWVASDYDELFLSYKGAEHFKDEKALDYLHLNSVAIDPTDNNLVISFASISQLVKINRETGDIIWRMGGGGGQRL